MTSIPTSAVLSSALTINQAWANAALAFASAEKAMNDFHRDNVKSKENTYEARASAEDAWAVYVDAHHAALIALLDAPAPDFAAVVAKLETAHASQLLMGGDHAQETLKTLASDIRRLAGIGSNDRREFDEALADYCASYAAFMAFDQDGAISLTGEARDQACIEACRVNNDAWDKLISTAAPDFVGVIAKTKAFYQQYAEHEPNMDDLAIICAEAARLTDGQALVGSAAA